tara:strand:- start:199 stop:762 length:564 start_codon:yes stop_codon:yes gene_type:complete
MPNPLAPGLISASIMSVSTSKMPHMVSIANAVDMSLNEWLRLPSSTVQGTGVGVVGSGGASGLLTVIPNPALMEVAFKGAGLLGSLPPTLYTPIAFGISGVYGIQGLSATVGVGGFVGGFVGELGLLISGLSRNLALNGITGVEVGRLSTGLGNGIYSHFLSSIVVGIITGGGGPSPSSSPVTCTIV